MAVMGSARLGQLHPAGSVYSRVRGRLSSQQRERLSLVLSVAGLALLTAVVLLAGTDAGMPPGHAGPEPAGGMERGVEVIPAAIGEDATGAAGQVWVPWLAGGALAPAAGRGGDEPAGEAVPVLRGDASGGSGADDRPKPGSDEVGPERPGPGSDESGPGPTSNLCVATFTVVPQGNVRPLVPAHYQLRHPDGGPDSAQVMVAGSKAVDGAGREVMQAHYAVVIEDPEGDSGSSSTSLDLSLYEIAVGIDDEALVGWLHAGTRLGEAMEPSASRILHVPDLGFGLALPGAVPGLGGNFHLTAGEPFPSPFELSGTVADLSTVPAGVPARLTKWFDSGGQTTKLDYVLEGLRFAPADVQLAVQPGTQLAEMLRGHDPGSTLALSFAHRTRPLARSACTWQPTGDPGRPWRAHC